MRYPILTLVVFLLLCSVGSMAQTPSSFTQGAITSGSISAGTKALTDNVATNFANVAIAQSVGANYSGGRVSYTIFCKDAVNQAEQHGLVQFGCHNLAGTTTCGWGTPDGVTLGDGVASIGTPTFTATSGTNAAVLKLQSDCTGVTPTTFTMEYRIEMERANPVTQQ